MAKSILIKPKRMRKFLAKLSQQHSHQVSIPPRWEYSYNTSSLHLKPQTTGKFRFGKNAPFQNLLKSEVWFVKIFNVILTITEACSSPPPASQWPLLLAHLRWNRRNLESSRVVEVIGWLPQRKKWKRNLSQIPLPQRIQYTLGWFVHHKCKCTSKFWWDFLQSSVT